MRVCVSSCYPRSCSSPCCLVLSCLGCVVLVWATQRHGHLGVGSHLRWEQDVQHRGSVAQRAGLVFTPGLGIGVHRGAQGYTACGLGAYIEGFISRCGPRVPLRDEGDFGHGLSQASFF